MRKTSKIILSSFILVIFLTCYTVVYASGFHKQRIDNRVFFNYDTKINVGEGVYPWSVSKDTKIENVGFDIRFGSSKGLIRYTGEVPYSGTRGEDDSPFSGFEGIPYSPSSKLKPLSDVDYWGDLGIQDGSELQPADLEAVNSKNEVKSLRLYALETASSGTNILQDIGYWLLNASLNSSMWLNKMVISLKNVDIVSFVNAVNLKGINEMLIKVFVGDENGGVSILFVLSTISAILVFTGFAIRYFRGNDKRDSLNNLLGTLIVSLIILAISYKGGAVGASATVAKFTNSLVQEIALDMNDSSDIFKTKVSNPIYSSLDVTMTENSLLNKNYIDLQICNQFGVKDIKELSLANLGDKDGTIALKTLTYYADVEVFNEDKSSLALFDNNLGYYFWYANSPNMFLCPGVLYENSIRSVTLQEEKLENVITFLQMTYNKALAENNVELQEKIKNIIQTFSNPNPQLFMFQYLVSSIVYFLLFITLITYAIACCKSKIMSIVLLFLLPISGLLMLTLNKKFVRYGKIIVFGFIHTFLEIIIYGIVFDLTICIIGSIMGVTFESLIFALVLMLVFFHFRKKVRAVIQELVDSIGNSIAPDFVEQRKTHLSPLVPFAVGVGAGTIINRINKREANKEGYYAKTLKSKLRRTKDKVVRKVAQTSINSTQGYKNPKIKHQVRKANKQDARLRKVANREKHLSKVSKEHKENIRESGKIFNDIEWEATNKTNRALQEYSTPDGLVRLRTNEKLLNDDEKKMHTELKDLYANMDIEQANLNKMKTTSVTDEQKKEQQKKFIEAQEKVSEMESNLRNSLQERHIKQGITKNKREIDQALSNELKLSQKAIDQKIEKAKDKTKAGLKVTESDIGITDFANVLRAKEKIEAINNGILPTKDKLLSREELTNQFNQRISREKALRKVFNVPKKTQREGRLNERTTKEDKK